MTQTPRKLRCWPEAIIRPPFNITSGVIAPHGIPRDEPQRSAGGPLAPRAKAAIGVTLHTTGTVVLTPGVTRSNPRQKTARAYFSLLDATDVLFEWVDADLPDTDILFLLTGVTDTDGEKEGLALTSWRAWGSARRWSVMPVEGIHKDVVVGIFRSRAVKDSCPTWFWHYLAGRALVDNQLEVRA